MILKALTPKKSLNKAYLKVKISREEVEVFKKELTSLLDRMNEGESEEFHKNLVIDFLKKTYYDPGHFVNTKGRNDLVIHNGNSAGTSVGVIVETKKPTNRVEMVSRNNLNAKALQELVLYYLRERITYNNLEVKHLVITNIYEWFVFDATVFERLFAQNKSLVQQFKDFEGGRLAGTTTDFFYSQIAQPAIEKIEGEVEFAYFDIRDYEKPLRNIDLKDDVKLIALFKLLSPEHLLKLPFANDSNNLDKSFYAELLHIIGLTETKAGGKKIIERNPKGRRHSGSILEDAIIQLDSLDKINRLDRPGQYGENYEERLFNVGLQLAITWINRILFLKLLEAQLQVYHKGNPKYQFLNTDKIQNFDDLNSLFFQVLAKKYEDRNEDVRKVFEHVPYLNSSLFEPTEMEHQTLFISNLRDEKVLPILSQTVLKDEKGKRRTGELTTLEYLFEFLNAYDFSSEGSEAIQEDNKSLINASVLGLIFEKINGYKDGSFFTPGFITMYMCRETIRKAVVQKFNEKKGWDCGSMDDLYDRIEDRAEANEIVNTIKICDPAVGSGHFLVSALNEMIAIKNDLKILQDREGRRLKEYHVEVVNDELIVTNEDGGLFEYHPHSRESRRVQEALFHEKQTIIENCLFGVDINPNSVKICRLRLWIELLKNAYYRNPDADQPSLETLPNIDINIKSGNSLISRFDLDADLRKALRDSKWTIEGYRNAVATYRNAENKEQKREMERLISDIKNDFRSEISANDPKVRRLYKLNGELFNLTQQQSLFDMSQREKAAWNKKVEKLTKDAKKLEAEIEEIKNNKIYENAFEWRFEFPEVLNEDGDFVGFDVVIGNPPYIKEYEGKEMFDGLRDMETYQGKIDMWYLFGELGGKIIKNKGRLTFIAPNNWVTNAGAKKFRNYILDNLKVKKIIDFGSYMIFESASIQTMIFEFKKKKLKNYLFDYRRINTEKPILEDVLNLLFKKTTNNTKIFTAEIDIDKLKDENFLFNDPETDKILNKIFEKGSLKLKDDEVGNGIHPHYDFVNNKIKNKHPNLELEIGQGIFGLSNEELKSLNLFEEEKTLIKPYFNSKQLHRYYAIKENDYWIIYTDSKFKNPDSIKPFPTIKNHLDFFADVITSDNKPYGLHRARNEDLFLGEKIIVQRKCPDRPSFTYIDFDSYVSATYYIIKTSRINNKYLIALLNSKLIEFWLRYKGKMQGNNFQLDKEPLINIPIAISNKDIVIEFEKLVEEILDLKEQNPSSDTSFLESEIDRLVYELYGLTEEEIGVVEGSF